MADAVARAWLTGTPEEPIINLDLPAGPKGEPGGWNVGTNLGTVDLDTITAPGLYYQSSTNGALSVANHYPPMKDMAGSARGILQVYSWSGGSAVIQRFTRIGSGATGSVQRPRVTYERYKESAWSEWSAVTPAQTITDTAGFKIQQTWDEQGNAWTDVSGPGGLVAGSHLNKVHLDTVTTAGDYRQTQGPDATLEQGYPVPSVGILNVRVRIPASENYGPSVVQEYSPIFGQPASESRVLYRRTQTGKIWQPWRAYTSQRVDNTAGRAIYTWDDTANREQLVYGDTGWRNIDSLLASANFIPQASSGRVAIRRTGSMVNLVLRLQASDALVAKNQPKNSLQVLLDVPVGFQEYPSSYGAAMVCTAMLGSYMEVLALGAVNSNSQLKIMGSTTQTWRSTEIISANVSWSTNDPWPTTLPGTAFGTIPNV